MLCCNLYTSALHIAFFLSFFLFLIFMFFLIVLRTVSWHGSESEKALSHRFLLCFLFPPFIPFVYPKQTYSYLNPLPMLLLCIIVLNKMIMSKKKNIHKVYVEYYYISIVFSIKLKLVKHYCAYLVTKHLFSSFSCFLRWCFSNLKHESEIHEYETWGRWCFGMVGFVRAHQPLLLWMHNIRSNRVNINAIFSSQSRLFCWHG